MIKEFNIKTGKREEIIDITKQVKAIIKDSKVKEGACIVYTPHATAAIAINENYDPSICEDFLEALRKLIPAGVWRHDKVDNNADSHIKSAIIGPSELILIKNTGPILGTWQGIMFCEFDGPRKRKVVVEVK